MQRAGTNALLSIFGSLTHVCSTIAMHDGLKGLARLLAGWMCVLLLLGTATASSQDSFFSETDETPGFCDAKAGLCHTV